MRRKTPTVPIAGDKVVLMWQLLIDLNAEIKGVNKMICWDYRKEYYNFYSHLLLFVVSSVYNFYFVYVL